MKIYLLIVLTALSLGDVNIHGGHTAKCYIEIKPRNVLVEFLIEKSVLNHFDLHCHQKPSSFDDCLKEYLKSKTKIEINYAVVELEPTFYEVYKRNVKVGFKGRGDFHHINDLTLENSCFFEYDDQFKNLVKLEYNHLLEDYEFNPNQKRIKIE